MLLKNIQMKKLAFSLLATSLFVASYSQKNTTLVIGTYTNSCESKGIYVYDFNTETAEFRLKNSTENVINPSYVTISPDKKFLYSVNESGKESTVSSFWFQPESGNLEFISKQDSKGADPCFIMGDDKNVFVANYSGGTISVFGKNKFGALMEAKQVIQHKGTSKNTQRQESAHVHMVQFTPDHKYVLANDLGTDKIYVYKYNPDAELPLTLKEEIKIKPGSGPRHLTFSNDGKFAYLLQELDGTLTVFSYNNGSLRKIEENSVADTNFKGENGGADIHISPDGKFLYATNRGSANDITCFQIHKDGKLKFVQRIPTLGKGPRNFSIDPTGNFLLVAHQYTNNVVVFKVDKTTGKLTDSGKQLELCSPVCLVFTP